MDSNLNSGYLLFRQKGPVEHVGVYLGNQRVFHCSPSNNAEIITFDDFAEGKDVKVKKINMENKSLLVQRLEKIINSSPSYDVLTNNCEQLANYLITGRKKSHQLDAFWVGALAINVARPPKSFLGFLIQSAFSGLALNLSINALRHYDGKVCKSNLALQ